MSGEYDLRNKKRRDLEQLFSAVHRYIRRVVADIPPGRTAAIFWLRSGIPRMTSFWYWRRFA
jgi:hypothetical protein